MATWNSRGLRGSTLEEFINHSNERYSEMGLALMQKIPTPITPVRMDKDTEGLLLITNDGELAHQLLSPKKHVDKVYFARIDGKVTEEDVRRFAEGLEIGEEKPTLPAHLEILKREEISEIRLTIREGKFHQVKRMFHAVGKEVIYLKRLQMGSLVLDPRLALGEYRELTGQELKALRDCSLSR